MLDIKLIRENPEKINELLNRRNPELSIDKVLEMDPGMNEGLLRYFITVVFADGILDDNEMALIFEFGREIGFSDGEIATAIGIRLREDFSPNAIALK